MTCHVPYLYQYRFQSWCQRRSPCSRQSQREGRACSQSKRSAVQHRLWSRIQYQWYRWWMFRSRFQWYPWYPWWHRHRIPWSRRNRHEDLACSPWWKSCVYISTVNRWTKGKEPTEARHLRLSYCDRDDDRDDGEFPSLRRSVSSGYSTWSIKTVYCTWKSYFCCCLSPHEDRPCWRHQWSEGRRWC